ncbi:MAG TPA: ATP-binding protein [Nanoarchaeota archaeon]|nr:ATP-binding protein [Nanoarchaeota archaeon]
MVLVDIIIGRDQEDIRKFGNKGCIFLGKHIVGEGEDAHYTNKIVMDVLRPHIVLVLGKRGSGKSYTGGVIAEELMLLPEEIKRNLSCVLIDIMGIFWSMKYPNERDFELLARWGFKPKAFPVKVFVPIGLAKSYEKEKISFDEVFAIRPDELSASDWALTFGFSLQDPLGILLERVLRNLKKKNEKYGIDEIIEGIENDKRATEKEKQALINRFISAKDWGIFSDEATPIEKFLEPGVATVLDVSLQEWGVRNLLLGILARKVYEIRMYARRKEEIAIIEGGEKTKIPMVWFIIDEAHEFLPNEGKTAASDALLTLVRQGRQPGISCVFITQRPNKLHEDAISQADLIISHRLTSKADLDALAQIMQTYLLEDIRKTISGLPKTKGTAIILDDNSERLYKIQVRPRLSWHAGGSPLLL